VRDHAAVIETDGQPHHALLREGLTPSCMPVYEPFTDSARKVLERADREAHRFNHEYVGTELVLLGLIEERGVAASVLKDLGIDVRAIRDQIETLPGPAMLTTGKLPFTPRVKAAIDYAIDDAARLNQSVASEHLRLALLRAQKGVAGEILENLGLNLDDVRDAVLERIGRSAPPRESEAGQKGDRSGGDLYPALVDPDVGLSEIDREIERLNDEKERAVANQEFERAASLRDDVERLRSSSDRERAQREWAAHIEKYKDHPLVKSCRQAITQLNSQLAERGSRLHIQAVEEARQEGLRLRDSLITLYQRLKDDPGYGLTDVISEK
jgi:ATP-dependent Clp protease ATP-binding subunit ClpA